MRITIRKEVFQKFHPQLQLAFLFVKDIDNKSKAAESRHLLREAELLIQSSFRYDTPKTHHLISPWAVAQQEFGEEAHHYQTSIERLLKRVLTRKSVKTKDTLTNLLNYLSLKYIIPIGADDREKIKGNMTFALAAGKERVDLFRRVKAKAFYYHDDKKVLGTKLDYWKNRKTALCPGTKSAIVHIEAIPPFTPPKLKEIASEARRLIASFCGGKVKVAVLDKGKREVKA